jgi:hypothetical protein
MQVTEIESLIGSGARLGNSLSTLAGHSLRGRKELSPLLRLVPLWGGIWTLSGCKGIVA